MNKKYLMLVFLFALVLIPIVNATGGVATFKKDQPSTIYQLCDTCTYVNVSSIELPTKQVVSINSAMVKSGSSFLYNYTFSNVGDGHYNVCGDKGGSYKCESIAYTVTGTGITGTIGFYIIILILTLGLIIIGYSVEDVWIIILGSFGMILFGLYILFFGIAGMEDAVYTWGLGIITLMTGAYFGVRASLEQLNF